MKGTIMRIRGRRRHTVVVVLMAAGVIVVMFGVLALFLRILGT